jgi:hypothetical protein
MSEVAQEMRAVNTGRATGVGCGDECGDVTEIFRFIAELAAVIAGWIKIPR